MSRILKWIVPIQDAPTSIGAGPVVEVAEQHGCLCVWTVESDTTAGTLERLVAVVGTGHLLPENARPISSVVMGAMVWHVVELMPHPPCEHPGTPLRFRGIAVPDYYRCEVCGADLGPVGTES